MKTRTESAGRCATCGAPFSKRQMVSHLVKCAYPDGKDVETVTRIRVDVPGSPFWLDVDVKATATLRELDTFLRDLWLDCCGHLSSFEVGPVRYVVARDEFFGPRPGERSMNARVSASLPPAGSVFAYEYDYGSTTHLRLKVVDLRQAPRRRDAVRLLARNEAPIWQCNECSDAATSLCADCVDEGGAFACEAHVEDHECGGEAMLPVVNSPRMGVCGYIGGA